MLLEELEKKLDTLSNLVYYIDVIQIRKEILEILEFLRTERKKEQEKSLNQKEIVEEENPYHNVRKGGTPKGVDPRIYWKKYKILPDETKGEKANDTK